MGLLSVLKLADLVHYKICLRFHLWSQKTTIALVSCTPAPTDRYQLHGSVLLPTAHWLHRSSCTLALQVFINNCNQLLCAVSILWGSVLLGLVGL